jgi:hypothetical protein
MMLMAVFGLKTPFICYYFGITDENESVKATLITILHEAYKLNQILLQIQTVILSRQNLVS